MSHCPHCGGELPTKIALRSVEQHRRYFALIRAAYHHWPNADPFQPDSEEHLRKYLQCKAGYYETTRIDIDSCDPAVMALARAAAEGAIKAAGGTAFIKTVSGGPDGAALIVFAPKSIAFAKLGHEAFCNLNHAVAEIIEIAIGIHPDTLLQEAEGAA